MIQFSSQKWFLRVLTGALVLSLSSCSLIVVHNPRETEASGTEETVTAAVPDPPVLHPETTEESKEPPKVSTKEKARKALASLRNADLNGMNFIIALQAEGAAFGEDETGEVLRSEALYQLRQERTAWAEEKYNAHILTFSYPADDLYREILDAYHSDTQFVADFYAIPASRIGRYQAEGLLLNLNSLPFTDYTKPYFDQNAMKQLTAGYSVLGAAGDYTYAPENAYAVYFNRDLLSSLGLESPYQLVQDGTWTYDVLFSYAKTAQGEASGSYFGDNFGVLGAEHAEAAALASAGLHMARSGFDRPPTLTADTDAVCLLADMLYHHITRSTTVPPGSAYTAEVPDDRALFENGQLLFYCGPLSLMYSWADIPVSWGVLPLPKLSAEQKHFYTYTGDASVFCVPSVTGVPESAGLMLQALFASSYDAYQDAFLDEALRLYVRDGKTVDMLDLIDNRFFYDFSSMAASGYPRLAAATTGALHQTQVSRYTFDTLYKNNKPAAEREMQQAFPVFTP